MYWETFLPLNKFPSSYYLEQQLYLCKQKLDSPVNKALNSKTCSSSIFLKPKPIYPETKNLAEHVIDNIALG